MMGHVIFLGLFFTVAVVTAGMTGGWRNRSVEDPDVIKLAQYATEEKSKSSNSLYHLKPRKVLNASSQVVAGTKYKITVEIGQTICKKNDSSDVDINKCELMPHKQCEICTVVIWSRVWLNDTQILDTTCKRCQ